MAAVAGCGNGLYLRALAGGPGRAAGCDLSMGMLRAAGLPALVNADVAALPFRDGAFDAVLAVHMLYHVPDRQATVRELRRVLAPGGVCIAVTNGGRELGSLRSLTEYAVRRATQAGGCGGQRTRSPPRTARRSSAWPSGRLPAYARNPSHP